MVTSRHLLIGQILVDLGYLKLEHVNDARRKQMSYPELKIGEILIGMNLISDEQLEKGLQVQKHPE